MFIAVYWRLEARFAMARLFFPFALHPSFYPTKPSDLANARRGTAMSPPLEDQSMHTANAKLLQIEEFVSLPRVCQIAGVSRGTLYNWVRDGDFPAPVQVGPRRIGWRMSDLSSWVLSRETVAWAA